MQCLSRKCGAYGLGVVVFGLVCGDVEEALGQFGACCRGDGTCVATDGGGCDTIGGEFLGVDTVCDTEACLGACCLPLGDCTHTGSDICVETGGVFSGFDSSCADTACAGACCLPQKDCTETGELGCADMNGSFQGGGSTCDTHCAARSGAGFTFQGQLKQDGVRVTDTIDIEASLWTALFGGDQVGDTLFLEDVAVANGLFSVELDFGAAALSGNRRFLELAVRRPHDPDDLEPFTVLAPRQELTPAPYAVFSQHAPWDGLTGIPADFADGIDDDTLDVLACRDGEVAKSRAGEWLCGADDDTTYTAGTGLVLDGTEFSTQRIPLAGVIVVAKAGGDFTSLQAALDSITDAAEDNTYEVRVAPGVFEENELVPVPAFVHLKGAGPGTTIVTSTREDTTPSSGAATVEVADSGRVSDLTIRNTGTGTYGIAVYLGGTSRDTVIDNIVAEAISGGGGTARYAIYLNDAEPTIKNSTFKAGGATGFGTAVNAGLGSVNVSGGFPQALILNSTFLGGGNNTVQSCVDNTGTGFGLQMSNSSPDIRNSHICGGHRGIALYVNGHPRIQGSEVRVSSTGSAFLFEITASGSISVATSAIAYLGNKFTGAGTGLRCVNNYSFGTWVPLSDGATAALACN